MGATRQHPGTHVVPGTGFSVFEATQTAAIQVDDLPVTTQTTPPLGYLLDLAGTVAIDPQALGLAAAAFTDSFSSDFTLNGQMPVATEGTTAAAAATRLTDQNTDTALAGNLAQSLYGVSGEGIKIGILSDSFNVLGGMSADIADGNLPSSVTILKEGPAGSHDEGRAMADIVHSIAPGAQIYFYSAMGSETDFAAGITALQQAGCNVIVDDVAYLDEPFFQDGSAVQTAVENAIASGVSYFTAASNEGTDYVQQNFTPMQLDVKGLPGGVVVQNFGSAADPQPWTDVTIPHGGEINLDMQWDQPFADIGDSSGSANSIGMALYDSNGNLVAIASTNDVGGNPVQTLTYTNSSASTNFRLVVFANGGASQPDMFKIINYGNGTINNDAGTGSGTVIGQEMLPGVNTVGAVNYAQTTAFGGTNAPESFSSSGTGEILYGANGQPLATPEITNKVNFLAPDGSVTSVFAPFDGTSAAAPAAAAVAALMLQANPDLTPGQVTTILEESALPSSGSIAAAGAGLIQADTAVQLALSFTTSHG